MAQPRRQRRTSSSQRSAAATPAAFESELDYLQQELAWIERRCRRIEAETRLRNPTTGAKKHTPGSRCWEEDEVSPRRLQARVRTLHKQETALRHLVDARLARSREQGRPTALDRLCDKYGLDAFERAVLLLSAAPCISCGFDDTYEKMDEERLHSNLTPETVFTFLQTPVPERVQRRYQFGPRGALVKADLVTVDICSRYSGPKDLLTADINISSRTFGYLVGDPAMADEFMEFSSVEEPRATMDQVVLSATDKARILSVVQHHDRYLQCRADWGIDGVIRYGRGVLMLFHGKPGTGKTLTAHAVAHALSKRVLNVDIPTFVSNSEAGRFLPGLFREARLQNAVLFFDECEAIFASRSRGNLLMTLLLTEIERFDGVAILATNLPQLLDEALDRRILVRVRFPEPDRTARLEIWRKHLPPTVPLAADVDLEPLADRFEMSGGYIKNAVLTAVAAAVHSAEELPRLRQSHLEEAALQQLHRPRDEEEDMVIPKVKLCDVVLPQRSRELVRELISAARSRRTVLERWGIGAHLSYGKGLSALFFGEPGTGKTLCAEAIAGELNRPLLVAAVPALVSKWVGQTESNLAELFKRAQAQGAVLFLDEADSLLTARGEGRASRHDDSAVNVLLQLIERHGGLTLLATNRPSSLDPALDRRLTYQLSFPLPDAEARAAIWRGLLPDTVPVGGGLDLCALARAHRLSGGQIKNAVFKAAFRAASAGQPLDQAVLLRAAAEEEESGHQRGNGRAIGFGAAAAN